LNIYVKKQQWKFILLIIAILIGVSSLYYTHRLVEKLSKEEQKKIQLWAEATKQLAQADLNPSNMSFLLDVVQNNQTIPIILTDSSQTKFSLRNFDSIKSIDTVYEMKSMAEHQDPIIINLGNGDKNYLFYKDSIILTQLRYYPYIQLGIILLFVFVAYLAFSSSRKAEQNKVWVGLTKETAHQLGTPTSSLLAWLEIMKEKNVSNDIITELAKDVHRLEKITDRFSKIGSKPALKDVEIKETILQSIEYLKSRTSERVSILYSFPNESIQVPLSKSLFEWVIENICKNAVDAIDGKGIINITVISNKKFCYIDITDNGKGIPKSKQKTIFKPGYTTKSRGWGLGLSLSKRIIEEYHKGKIFVINSEAGKGTTIRIALRKE